MQTEICGATGEPEVYCTKCGNSGRVPFSTEVCECKRVAFEYQLPETRSIEFIPEYYVGRFFQEDLVADAKPGYTEFLRKVHDTITTYGKSNLNYYIASKAKMSKQVFAYSVMQILAVSSIKVFPIWDLYEIRRYINMYDAGKDLPRGVDMEALYSVPVLFVKSIGLPTREILETIHVLIDRRVRQGVGTIILSNIKWHSFITMDKYSALGPYSGDGKGTSIAIREWFESGV